MENKNNKEISERSADLILKKSKREINLMTLISGAHVKLWKALIVSFFVVGFVGALALMVGTEVGSNIALRSKASGVEEISLKDNIAPMMDIYAPSFAKQDYGWGNLVKSGEDEKLIARKGGVPFVDFSLPGDVLYAFTEIVLSNALKQEDITKCGLKEFSLRVSKDGQRFDEALNAVKANQPGFESFTLNESQGVEAKVLRLLFKSNWGDRDWICLQEVRLMVD